MDVYNSHMKKNQSTANTYVQEPARQVGALIINTGFHNMWKIIRFLHPAVLHFALAPGSIPRVH